MSWPNTRKVSIGLALLGVYFPVLPNRGLWHGRTDNSIGNRLCLEGHTTKDVFFFSIFHWLVTDNDLYFSVTCSVYIPRTHISSLFLPYFSPSLWAGPWQPQLSLGLFPLTQFISHTSQASCQNKGENLKIGPEIAFILVYKTSRLHRPQAQILSDATPPNRQNPPIHQNVHNFWTNAAIFLSFVIYNSLSLWWLEAPSKTVWAWQRPKAVGGQRATQLVTKLITMVFIERSLALSGPANYALSKARARRVNRNIDDTIYSFDVALFLLSMYPLQNIIIMK